MSALAQGIRETMARDVKRMADVLVLIETAQSLLGMCVHRDARGYSRGLEEVRRRLAATRAIDVARLRAAEETTR